jgi:hypothetical protein
MSKADAHENLLPAQRISRYISELSDWRGPFLARLRQLILEAEPHLTEDWKWETPVWACRGNVVAAAAFNDHVKLNFFRGAALKDPQHLFNAGLEAKATRAIDLHEHDTINGPALQDLIRAAVAHNTGPTQ